MARQLSKVLGYSDFRNFTGVIEKAWNACKNSGNDPKDHIVEANEMLVADRGEALLPQVKLSRYAGKNICRPGSVVAKKTSR